MRTESFQKYSILTSGDHSSYLGQPFRWMLMLFCLVGTYLEGGSGCQGAAHLVYEMDPATIVHNVVSAESGALCLMDVDLPMEGPDALPLVRFYNSLNSEKADFGEGTRTNYPTRVSFVDKHDDHYHVWVEEPGGSSLQFTGRGSSGEISFSLDQRAKDYGTVNTCGGEISGRTNLKNQQLTYKSNHKKWWKGGKKGLLSMSLGSGETKTFESKKERNIHRFQLIEEKKSNGNSVHYDYASDNYWKRIWTLDPMGRELRWLEFDDRHMGSHLTYRASNGRSVEYFFSNRLRKKYGSTAIERVVPSHGPELHYKWSKPAPHRTMARLMEIGKPDDRYLRIQYNKAGQVAALVAPAGPSGKAKQIYRFDYVKKKGWAHTSVIDSEGGTKRYHFDRWHRLTEIDFFDRGKLVRTQYFRWQRSGVDVGNLVSKGIKNAKGEIICCCTLQYDIRGNVVEETFYGDLTGEGADPIVLDKQWMPLPGNHSSFTKQMRYSEDGRNLKVWEQEEGGPEVEYVYRDGTDLLLARYVSVDGLITQREFHEYDEAGLLLQGFTDDGCSRDCDDLSGVTQRTSSRYLRQTNVNEMGYGQPLVEERFATDPHTGKQELLDKRHYTYGVGDQLLTMDRYDSDGQWQYQESFEYDEKGRLISETNALGERTQHEYDANFNRICSEKMGVGYRTEYRYDRENRLVQQDEIHASGEVFTNHFGYDSLGRKNREVDQFGETTLYNYDGLGRLVEKVSPGIPDLNGSLIFPEEKRTYDSCDQVISEIDLAGDETTFSYNSRGQKTLVVYPDGTEERFRYATNGTLIERRSRSGATTTMAYDPLKRLISSTTTAKDGSVLDSESREYGAFQLLHRVDGEGTQTTLSYDYAGRKIKEIVKAANGDTSVVCTQYDNLGRAYKTRQLISGNSWLTTVREFDFLDREIAGWKEDGLAAYRYEYDLAGHRTLVAHERADGIWDTTTTEYDGRGRPLVKTDPTGGVTMFQYVEAQNAHGQRVQTQTVTDPVGNVREESFDAHGRVARRLRYDSLSLQVGETSFVYDGCGRILRESHAVMNTSRNETSHVYSIEWKRGPGGRVELLREPDEKITHYHYNEQGLKSEVVKCDSVSLYYSYDEQGHLTRLWSSDQTVDHSYRFNSRGELIGWDQESRELGLNGSVTREEWHDGLVSSSEYDGIGRRLSLELPGANRAFYEYDALGVVRISRDQLHIRSEPTDFVIEEKDLQGRPLVVKVPGPAGRVTYSYDEAGRLSGIHAPHYSENLTYDASGRLRETLGTINQSYKYDGLGQLTAEQGDATHTFGYDSVNNRLMVDDVLTTVDGANRLLASNGRSFDYDENGNIVLIHSEMGSMQLEYDALGRLVRVVRDGETLVTYRYDALHRRRQELKSDGTVSTFLYDGMREVGVVRDGKVTELRILMDQKGAERGGSVLLLLDEQCYVPIHNHRGDIVRLVDAKTGSVVGESDLSAFGETIRANGIVSPWTFQGKRFDQQSGFFFFGRRYYDPVEGRWTSPDPGGFIDGPNLYAYCHNNPATAFDAFGLYAEEKPSVWTRIKTAARRTFRSQSRARMENSQRPKVQHGPTLAGLGDSDGSRPYNQTVGMGEVNNRIRVGYTHGNDTTPEKALADAQWLSNVHGGVNVTATVYGTTGSATSDLFRRSLPSLTMAKQQVGAIALAEKWKSQIGSMGGVGPNRHIDEYCHSNGNIVAFQALHYHMPPEMRKMVRIHALASPVAIPNRLCGKVTHYVNHYDTVTLPARIEAYFQPQRYSMQLVGKGGFQSLRSHSIRDSIYSDTVRSLGRQFELEHGRVR